MNADNLFKISKTLFSILFIILLFFKEDKLSDYSLERSSQLELSKIHPSAQSSPITSKTANITAEQQLVKPQVNSSTSLYDQLSFTITITPTIFVLGTSLTINCALIYYFIFWLFSERFTIAFRYKWKKEKCCIYTN